VDKKEAVIAPVTAKRRLSRNYFLHIHDNRISNYSLKPFYTMGFGLILVSLFAILAVTGVLMMFYYVPSTDRAYDSVKDIIYMLPGGRYLRNLHRWSGHAMVAVAFLHLARLVFTQAYSNGRARNWIFGLIMFLSILLMSFSGYLLPWDQLSYWAITICSNIAASTREITDAMAVTSYFDIGGWTKRLLIGDDVVGQPALSRFFTLHTMLLPVAMILLMGYHFWRIRKDGGLNHNHKEKQDSVYAWPTLMWAELAVFLSTFAIMLLIATFVDAPLREEANPALPENPAKAPWYFLGIQELVSYSSFAGGILVPLLFLLFLVSLPFMDRSSANAGTWFSGKQGRTIVLQSFILGFITTAAILLITANSGWARDWFEKPPILLLQILNPGIMLAAIFVVWSIYIRRRKRSPGLAAMGLFTAAITALILFTITGVWFRGVDWQLLIFNP
jgi:quinol-cytochrome oxidoreductase complex cytochrome b subunit